MKKLAISLGVVTLLLAAAFFALRTPDSEVAEMRVKYAGVDSQFVVTSSGLSVHYRDQGCRECAAIVLIHGSNASLHTFEPLVRVLGDRYRLISYDQPGHGLTGPHPLDDYSARGMAEAIDAVIDATGVETFAIIGNSMGGWVAWRYALDRPGELSALVLISASGAPKPPNVEEPRLHLGARILQNPIGRFFAQHITPRPIVEQSLLDSIADESLVTADMVDRYWELLRLPGNRRAAGLLTLVDREPEYGRRLGELSVPTLILWGQEDVVVPLYNATTFDEMIPDSKLQVFEGVGHLAMEEVPERTAAAIDEFLRLIQPANPGDR